MKNLGVALAGGGTPVIPRAEQDFYSSPPGVIRALIRAEGCLIPDRVLEPACGDGAISRELIATGRSVVSCDLVYRGYGFGGQDFTKRIGPWNDAIVTNPPFKRAAEFIHKARDLGVSYLALLLKATYWHAYKTRGGLFLQAPPSAIYALGWRPDFLGLGSPTMDVMWCVWRRNHAGPTTYALLPGSDERLG